jgi:hypothetical protein
MILISELLQTLEHVDFVENGEGAALLLSICTETFSEAYSFSLALKSAIDANISTTLAV